MFKKYRILEINGMFMPQYKKYFLDNWEGIGGYCTWKSKTIEQARAVIDIHKETIKKNKTIIHKYGK